MYKIIGVDPTNRKIVISDGKGGAVVMKAPDKLKESAAIKKHIRNSVWFHRGAFFVSKALKTYLFLAVALAEAAYIIFKLRN